MVLNPCSRSIPDQITQVLKSGALHLVHRGVYSCFQHETERSHKPPRGRRRAQEETAQAWGCFLFRCFILRHRCFKPRNKRMSLTGLIRFFRCTTAERKLHIRSGQAHCTVFGLPASRQYPACSWAAPSRSKPHRRCVRHKRVPDHPLLR